MLPTLNSLPTERSMTASFVGYDHRDRIADGAFYDCENLSCDLYPVLSQRERRTSVIVIKNAITGVISKDALCYTEEEYFVMNDYDVDIGLSSGNKTLISMGAYVIILPDKKYVNTEDLTDFGNIEAHTVISTTVSYSMTDLDGAAISPTVSATAPANPANMDYWMDTSHTPHVLKQWSADASMWVTVPTSYIKIAATGIGAAFREGDGVFFTGLPASMSDYSGASVLQKVYHGTDGVGDYLLILGQLDESTTTQGLTVDRSMPDMDFVIESNNRLWGCKYGLEDGKPVNEIYACKLGDFRNWYCYEGISTDSYAVSLGSDGSFTGAVNYLGYPIFFKETCLHKIYGAYPSQYQVQTTPCRGVQAGSGKSLAMVNEVLYYKSANAICAYDGSLPTEISAALGEERYSDAVGGSVGNRYYVDMRGEDNERHLFLYDAARGIWQKETTCNPITFANHKGMLYYTSTDGHLWCLKDILPELGSMRHDYYNWYGVSGLLGLESPDGKYISRVTLRLALDEGTVFRLFIEYDSSGDWVEEADLSGHDLRSFSLPIRLRRCDHFRMKIQGHGNFKLFSVTKTVEEGGEWT